MKRPTRWALILLAAITVPVSGGCAGARSRDAPGGSSGSSRPSTLTATEVRQYEGKDLSSIGDFRENSIKGPQHVDVSAYRLRLGGLLARPGNLTYDQVLARQRFSKVVRLDCVEGWGVDILWEGVLVRDLLKEAGGARPGGTTIVFRAVDGYSTSFPLEYVTDNDILLAYKVNGVVLPPERGFPFQLVAEDKWGYKWIRWVTSIEVTSNAGYRGYWESRGYSSSGDRQGPEFGP